MKKEGVSSNYLAGEGVGSVMKNHSLYKPYKDTHKSPNNKAELVKKLKKGEDSGFVKDFNRDSLLKTLHQKHITK